MLEHRILVVDDDPSWQELLNESIQEAGLGPYTLRVASSRAEADALLDRQHFHLAFVDLRLREETRDLEGKLVAGKIVRQNEGTSIVIATGHADVETALTALKEWQVLDFVLKDAWEPDKVAQLARAGIPAARERYRTRYESAVDFLRGAEGIMPWTVKILQGVAARTDATRPDRRLGDLLNALLDDLHPLLPLRTAAGVVLDPAAGTATARFWSKALGAPIIVCFGCSTAIEQAALSFGQGFARIERTVADDALGIQGIVCTPEMPPFEDFAS